MRNDKKKKKKRVVNESFVYVLKLKAHSVGFAEAETCLYIVVNLRVYTTSIFDRIMGVVL